MFFLPNEFSFNMNIKENHYHTISVQFLYNGFEITFNENIYGKKNVKINFKHFPIVGQITQLSPLEKRFISPYQVWLSLNLNMVLSVVLNMDNYKIFIINRKINNCKTYNYC